MKLRRIGKITNHHVFDLKTENITSRPDTVDDFHGKIILCNKVLFMKRVDKKYIYHCIMSYHKGCKIWYFDIEIVDILHSRLDHHITKPHITRIYFYLQIVFKIPSLSTTRFNFSHWRSIDKKCIKTLRKNCSLSTLKHVQHLNSGRTKISGETSSSFAI